MDLRQTDLYAGYMRSLGWIVEKISGTNVFIKKILFFSVIKIQRFKKLDFEKLKGLAKKYRAVLINLEPGSKWHLLPTKTVILDLDNVKLPKDTKYEIRKAEDRGLKVQESKDIEKFYELLQGTMKLGHWEIPIHKEVANLYKSFQPNNSVLLLACPQNDGEGAAVAGCLIVWHDETAHYMYAANTATGRQLSAAYLTLWGAIKFCQKKGLKFLDLEGIYDERFPNENKPWRGFTKFKMGWGGKIIEYTIS